MEGDESEAELHYIIRDHDRDKFEARKQHAAAQSAAYLNGKYGAGTVSRFACTDSYYNMKEKILPHLELLDWARAAMRRRGWSPVDVPIRGGTDGARLSFHGPALPEPVHRRRTTSTGSMSISPWSPRRK